MSASPAPPATVSSQKRPLEEHSSESGVGDQPDAKRPALDRDEGANGTKTAELTVVDGTSTANATTSSTANATGEGAQAAAAGASSGNATAAPLKGDAPAAGSGASTEAKGDGSSTLSNMPSSTAVLETQPIQSTTSTNGAASTDGTFANQHQDETGWLHVRAIISSAEAATVIGKGGENVTLIRRMSGAKCTVSDYSRGAVERVLTVSGLVDAIAKAFGLIIRTLNQEPLEAASTPQSKIYPLKLLIPHILVGSIIGQKGVRIREIQDASGARLNVSDSCMPLSTERSVVVVGVADAVHIATYYVGSTLVEQLTERFGGPAASAYATRSGGPAGVVPGGMQVVPYNPLPAGGQWGHPESYRRHPTQQMQQRGPANAYGIPYTQGQQSAPLQHPQTAMHFTAGAGAGVGAARHAYTGAGPQMPQPYGQQQGAVQPAAAHGAPQQPGHMGMPGPLTQQIFIPNDMVGAIIGKGGIKINEIRQASGSVIKINEPQENSNERLVTITGTQECNQMALYLLYQRLGQLQTSQSQS